MRHLYLFAPIALVLVVLSACATVDVKHGGPKPMERIALAGERDSFALVPSGRPWVPWGFNYDHDDTPAQRLLEDYWDKDWKRVERDFATMRVLGANVVRIHLQIGRFMRSETEPDGHALWQLQRVLRVAETEGLWVDVTGLCNDRPQDTPEWFSVLPEPRRWEVQARFWGAVAEAAADSPAVFAYDLMNEPAVPYNEHASWFGPRWFDGRSHVELISRDPAGRPRNAVALQWLRAMAVAVRSKDPSRLITVGLFSIDDQTGDLGIGLTPHDLALELDFLSLHLYPTSGKLEVASRELEHLSVGKPVVIEEAAPLECSVGELKPLVEDTVRKGVGWLGFYWGDGMLRERSKTPMAEWVGALRRLAPPR
jgi:hypothetical protein